MIPAGHAGGDDQVTGRPFDMRDYANEITELDMEVGRAALTLNATLQALFEHQTTKVDMEQLPVPTRDDWGVARRIVDHAVASSEADRWVGTVGRALQFADTGLAPGPHVAYPEVSQQELDQALAGLISPLSATGNVYRDAAALEEWNNLINCENGGYGGLVGGVLSGPDGRMYPVADPGDSEARLGNGWSTIGSSQGDIVLGEGLSRFDKLTIVGGSIVGGGYTMAGWQSLGRDQRTYLRELAEPSYQSGRPPGGGPPDPTHWVRPEIRASETDWRNRMARVDRAGGRVDMAVGALEGLENVQQAENNRHYVSEVVFQEHVDGPRRAVIHIYQVQSDGSRVRVGHHHGKINPDGSVGLVPES